MLTISGRSAARHLALAITGACLLAACATPYQPKGATGGFAERKIGQGRYEVSFSGNGNTSAALVGNMYLYRCAELTVRDGYDVFRSADPDKAANDVWVQGRAATGADASAGALAPMAGSPSDTPLSDFRSGGGGHVPIYIPGTTHTVTRYSATGLVRMARYDDAPSNVRVWDARAVMRLLEPIVRGSSRTPLTTEQVAQAASVYGRGAPISAGASTTSLDDLRQLLGQ